MGKSVGIADQLAAANGRLDKVQIRVKGDRLYIRGSAFPTKPGNEGVSRYELATGCKYNEAGIQSAYIQAKAIDGELLSKTFSWTRFDTHAPTNDTVAGWVERFKDHWFSTRPDGIQNQRRWYAEKWQYLRQLPQDRTLTTALLRKGAIAYSPATKSRFMACQVFRELAEFARLDGVEDIKALGKGYTSRSVDPRELPTDAEIKTAYESIKNPGWRWIFAVMAIYGLRNHEAFFLDVDGLQTELKTVRVTEGKTGPRICFPCPADDWDFDLLCEERPKIQIDRLAHHLIGGRVAMRFQKMQIGFTPYCLRHSFARRAFEKGWNVRLAAKSMGHSPQLHTSTYQRWWSEGSYVQMFKAMKGDRGD